jgi:hypothetical protein
MAKSRFDKCVPIEDLWILRARNTLPIAASLYEFNYIHKKMAEKFIFTALRTSKG